MKKVTTIVRVIALISLLILVSDTAAYPGTVLISSPQGEIPIIDDIFRMGPSTGFLVPFTLRQSFDVPPGASKTYGTIAQGPCWAAEFVGATPGYTTGDYPTLACSWIMWEPPPDIVTVTVRYTGNWLGNYISLVRWDTWEDGAWVDYCLIGEPNQYGSCPAGIYFEAQPALIHLPIILKGMEW